MALLPRDVLYLIISYVLPSEKDVRHLKKYCDDCTKELVKIPRCSVCLYKDKHKYQLYAFEVYEQWKKCKNCKINTIYLCKMHTHMDIDIECEKCITL